MNHTDHELQEAADRLEHQLDDLDPDTVHARDSSDLRAIAEAVDDRDRADAKIRERVQIARAHGRSWNLIAVALGVSRQAARERFADKVNAS